MGYPRVGFFDLGSSPTEACVYVLALRDTWGTRQV